MIEFPCQRCQTPLRAEEGQVDLIRLSRISALRIFTLCGLSLVLGVSLHSSYQGWMLGHYEVLLINFTFYAILLALAGFALRFLKSMSVILLMMMGLGGLAIIFLVREFMSDIQRGILLQMLSQDIKCSRVSTYFIRWDGMLLGFRQKIMLLGIK